MNRDEIFKHVEVAFDLGRWVLTTDSDGRPREITIDLAERPDDLFGELTDADFEAVGWTKRPPAPTDDHGATIPAQGETTWQVQRRPSDGPKNTVVEEAVRVYEFALQDAVYAGALTLDQVVMLNAPDFVAACRADWVHVFDRVTRERRTLKRPEPDAVLTGLRDVAADLRRRNVSPAVAAYASALRGAPVDPPFGCAALPPIGPLTSTDGLQPGDVLRVIYADGTVGDFGGKGVGDIVVVRGFLHQGDIMFKGARSSWACERFAFVGRPDADGWIPWAGGENPVGSATVDVIFRDGQHLTATGEVLDPFWRNTTTGDGIDRFRIVDTPS